MSSEPDASTSRTSLVIPTQLAAPEPGWTISADVIVIGSGIAGLSAAIGLRRLGLQVLIVTKSHVEQGSTRWAQGGIAAALAEEDSPAQHEHDTMVAGAGLCDPAAVHQLCTGGPAAVRNLIQLGARFDQTDAGDLALTREGGHLRDRIAHAGGDATGVEIFRTLVSALAQDPGVTLIEHALALDLLLDSRGSAQGVTLHVIGEGQQDGVGAALAPAVVLATGGLGQVFSQTTNPAVATGDGVALALRAGAEVTDLEFVQFHPTVMYLGPDSSGQQPLVSEAVRGEGGFLVDDDGVRFMAGAHPLADLAPRDVVAKAIMRRMRMQGRDHMWLDARGLASRWAHRFPTILESCRSHGIDPAHDLIPVAPAQHYASGGVRTDLHGRTTIPGLYAAGEAACTGVHGANRLASNSLLEGVVFPERIVAHLAKAGVPVRREPEALPTHRGLVDGGYRRQMQALMTQGVGVLRSEQSLTRSLAGLGQMLVGDLPQGRSLGSWEATNLHAISAVMTAHALARRETRGSHWREDFPSTDDRDWRVRLAARVDVDGAVGTSIVVVPGRQFDREWQVSP